MTSWDDVSSSLAGGIVFAIGVLIPKVISKIEAWLAVSTVPPEPEDKTEPNPQ